MSLIQMQIERIQYSETQSGAYVLFLKEPLSNKRLPIVIGGIEAHSIAIGLEKDIAPQRPLTHDLMKSLMESYHINLKKIIIHKFDQGIFYALLITEKDAIEMSLDSRTSDAVALAVRYDAPIFCERSILDEAGIIMPDESSEEAQEKKEEKELEDLLKEIDAITKPSGDSKKSSQELSDLEKLSIDLFGSRTIIYAKEEVQAMLDEAIENEQYEKAAKLKQFLDLM